MKSIYDDIKLILMSHGWGIDPKAKENSLGEKREFIHPKTKRKFTLIDAVSETDDREVEESTATTAGQCQYKGCEQNATDIARGREIYKVFGNDPSGHPGVGIYCEWHTDTVSEEGSPEYRVSCPNCGCCFGVN